MEVIVIATVALLTTASILLASNRGQRKKESVADVWSALAQRLQGRFEPAGGSLWHPTPERVSATLPPGITVTLDHHTVTSGESAEPRTRIWALATGMEIVELELSAHGVMASLRQVLGGKRHALRDHDFDRRFVLRTSHPALAEAWLGEAERRLLLATSRDYTILLRGSVVEAERVGYELDPEVLVWLMRAVAALAAAGATALARWRRVAEAFGSTVDGATFVPGQTRFTGEHLGRPIMVETIQEPPGTRMSRALGGRDGQRFELASGAALASLPGAARLFPAAGAEARWAAIQPAHLVSDGETAFLSWEGYVPDLARATEAAALLASLEEPTGPYR